MSRPHGRALLFGALFVTSCQDATQVSVDITTDVACPKLQSTSVTAGILGEIESRPAGTTTERCDPGKPLSDVGSIVIVPSGDDDEAFAVKIVGGVDIAAEACTPPKYEGCIVARRALSFVPETPLRIPVTLRTICKDVVCEPSSTCYNGKCVSALIDDPSACAGAEGCTEQDLFGDAPATKARAKDGGGHPAPDPDAPSPPKVDASPDLSVGGSGGTAGAPPDATPEPTAEASAGAPNVDAAVDVPPDAPPDVPPDTPPDVPVDAGSDAIPDTVTELPATDAADAADAGDASGLCADAASCDDSDVCNGIETCGALLGCQPGTPLSCDDGVACNGVESCDALLGCQPGTPLSCVEIDGVACTVPSCDAVTGCFEQPTDALCAPGVCDAILGCTACAAPMANCDGNPADCETDTDTSSANCGGCLHDCLGGTCVAGKCQPNMVATSVETPYYISVDSNFVYYTCAVAGGNVMKLPIGGGSPTPVAIAEPFPYDIVDDATHVYWTNRSGGTVRRADKATWTVETVTTTTTPYFLALDGATVYFTDDGDGAVYSVPKGAGGTATAIETGVNGPYGLAVDGTWLYWTAFKALYVRPLAGGPTVDLHAQNSPTLNVFVDGTRVLWTEWANNADVWMAPAGSAGPVTYLGTTPNVQKVPVDVIADGTYAYWTTTQAPGVQRAALAGGAVQNIATSYFAPRGLAQDAVSIWFADTGQNGGGAGSIQRLRKEP